MSPSERSSIEDRRRSFKTAKYTKKALAAAADTLIASYDGDFIDDTVELSAPLNLRDKTAYRMAVFLLRHRQDYITELMRPTAHDIRLDVNTDVTPPELLVSLSKPPVEAN